jgi:membrane protease YdiL (CAAX protease family)
MYVFWRHPPNWLNLLFMNVLRNLSYAFNAFLCRHSDQISKVACLIAAVFFAAVIFDSLFFAGLLIGELQKADNLFADIFISSWIFACTVIAPPACGVIAYKCYKASQNYGWRNLAY